MEEQLENFEEVLKKLVFPKFPNLLADVKVWIKWRDIGDAGITISYLIKDRVDYHYGYKIERETLSLYNMMGFDNKFTPRVSFRTESDWKF